MSHPHDIDNERVLFQFDSFDTRQVEPFHPHPPTGNPEASAVTVRVGTTSSSMATTPSIPFNSASSAGGTHGSFTDEDQFSSDEGVEVVVREGVSLDKGKGPSRPLQIQRNGIGTTDDIFSMSPLQEAVSLEPRSRSGGSSPTITSSMHSPVSPPAGDVCHERPSSLQDGSQFSSAYDVDSLPSSSPDRKGKAREVPPVLPPLTFTPGFEYNTMNWPTPSSASTGAGSSSYASSYAVDSAPQETQSSRAISPPSPLILTRVPSRRRSLSSLSALSPRTVSGTRMKPDSPRGPSNLARKLLGKSRGEPESSSGHASLDESVPFVLDDSGNEDFGAGGCFIPWRSDHKIRPKSAIEYVTVPAFTYDTPTAKALDSQGNARVLRTQGRSYSCPISPLDIVLPSTSCDAFNPIQLPVRRPFDDTLPREVKLHIFKFLVLFHEREYEKLLADGKWTALKASSSRNRWVGKDKGVRELVKLSRVSTSWRSLVFDGQLWSELAPSTFPRLPLSTVANIVTQSGAFLNGVDLTGHTSLTPESLFKLSHTLCIPPALPDNGSITQLKTLKLQGCTVLTTRSLHDLLIRSPLLESLCLKGLAIVNNTTCDLLSTHCLNLTTLNISRCPKVDADGLRSLVSGASARNEPLRLRELRISGLKYITDNLMAALGRAAPYLEILDLSYIRDLHNSAIDAFVSCPLEDEDDHGLPSVVLTSRDIGRDPGDVTKYRRRITRLRHINLSYCLLLTDIVCSNLAHCVPRLEIFEMAGIGPHLKDDGLVQMLNTTPYLRKLDLEDAMDINDAVLRNITPTNDTPSNRKPSDAPQTGHALEHLVVSYAVNVSNEALLGLIRNCSRLRVLEADSTRITGNTMKEFVRLSHQRKMADARVVAIDCRSVSESAVTDLQSISRPRLGWRSYEAKKLAYLDGRDEEDLGVGQDECDDRRVVVKTFYSWEVVDAVRSARDKKRKATRRAQNSSGNSSEDYFSGRPMGRARWWSPGGRLRSGNNSPSLLDINNDRDGCTIM